MEKLNKLFKWVRSARKNAKIKKINVLQSKIGLISKESFIKKMFALRVGYKLNLRHPKTFNEKMQWIKMHYKNPNQTKKVDKILVREFVKEKIGEQYLIPIFGCWDSLNISSFECMPDEFVLKCNHDSGSYFVCTNKENIVDKIDLINYFNEKLKDNYYFHFYENPYFRVQPKVLCEKLLKPKNGSIVDYKFYIFHGAFRMLMICLDRGTSKEKKIFYDDKLNVMPVTRKKGEKTDSSFVLPTTVDKMIVLAKTLASDDFFARVDFYDCDGSIYFGEITYFPGSGALNFYPKKYDYIIGSWLDLNKIKESKYYIDKYDERYYF